MAKQARDVGLEQDKEVLVQKRKKQLHLKKLKRSKTIENAGQVLRYIFLSLYAAITVFPILWVLSNSFRDNSQIFTNFTIIPEQLNFDNYTKVLTRTDIPLSFWHSFSITMLSLVLLLMVVLPLSFAISRFKFTAANYIFMFFSMAIFVPTITVLPMLYKLYNDLGFLGHKYPIVFSYVVEQLPIATFLVVIFMRAIPNELEEAAIIDGCSIWNMFLKIIVPLSKNAVVTISILAFVAIWNDYIQALIMLPDFRTLTVQLSFAKDEYTVDYGMMAAAIIFAITPVIIFYFIMKEQIMKGMAAGAVKG